MPSTPPTHQIISILNKYYPDANCSLHYTTPWQLLAATICSAQNLDATVNKVTESLFAEFPDAESVSNAPINSLRLHTKKLNYWRNKTNALRKCARIIAKKYHGTPPYDRSVLESLPGVGRKTASVFLHELSNQTDSIVVDTHVGRISQRIGWSKEKTPEKIERDLLKHIPPEWRKKISHILIAHGRALCKARTPNCLQCPLSSMCKTGKKILAKKNYSDSA